jgi:3-deoxy-manno-octulosonate cytidylyltransferase (CMP-KDO synthetase)
MTAVGVIPARMASTRFPGKPLTPIAGRPMLAWCHDGAARSELLDAVVIATCDAEIEDWARREGIGCVMTADTHVRATDRVAEAAESLDAEHIVLIQGDEPLVTPRMIDLALRPVVEGRAEITNLQKRLVSETELNSPNLVKVVSDRAGRALYMSRSPLPTTLHEGFSGIAAYNQVAIFGFTRERLLDYPRLEPTPYEIAESVDMLRYIEHGNAIIMVETTDDTYAVDVPGDVAEVERRLAAP